MAKSTAERSPQAAPGAGSPTAGERDAPYRVLARKYRPARFADLIGQEAMVRTLSNAIAAGRLAHAFILTGVRGVGKTTTARIIARALNCIGGDGNAGPTADPCGTCEHCTAIAQDRHVDVIEMDAASRTGIDDIRELIEGVRYRPVSARYKVYIIDEVHMLSRQAFNGLLKTLEEPPEHVIFIFATTEIRKVPVTVLSRCQRFDLARVPETTLVEHFTSIAGQEGIEAEAAALAMIARAADGSVRDGLSLLDQAIALGAAPEQGDGKQIAIAAGQVRDMLGMADRTRIFDLFEAVMRGRVAEALKMLSGLYRGGADPVVVLQDLLELTHFVTRMKLVPEIADDPATPEAERVRGGALAEKLDLPALARAWQMLLKGLGETRTAPAALQAAEMVLIRLAYASDLPTPGDLVAQLTEADGATQAAPAAKPASAQERQPTAQAETEPPAEQAPEVSYSPQPNSWAEVIALVRNKLETKLANHLAHDAHLVRFEVGRIEFRPGAEAPRNLAGQLGRLLAEATNQRWVVSVSSDPGEETHHAQQQAEEVRRRDAVLRDPLVQALLESFPEAKLTTRRDAPGNSGARSGNIAVAPLPDGGDEDDLPDDQTPIGRQGEQAG